jgi:Uma2 family endonuclease
LDKGDEAMSMVAAPPASQTQARSAGAEQRLLLHDVSWDAYVQIGAALRDRPALRMTYDRGSLEFMTTSPEHEILKRRLSRLIETLAEEHGLPWVSAGNMTFQREDLDRGFEADDCFWIAHEAQIRGRLDWDPNRDPPPDLALEIEISRSALGRMAIYAALGIPEVWRFDGATLHVHLLRAGGDYQPAERSPTFPKIPLGELVQFLRPDPAKDSLTELRSFREWVRARLATS